MKRVYIPGVWDLFHIGHLNVLREAKKLGDYLVVGVCSDDICINTKCKPIIKEDWRLEVIENIKFVDYALVYRNLDYFQYIKDQEISIFAVGEEFGYLEEHQRAIALCKENKIEMVKIPRYPGISSTIIKEKIL
jgi:glycerol-3-phosphate cytidylyltransferase